MLINSAIILTQVSIINTKEILQSPDFQAVYLILDINDTYAEKVFK
jgi:hypothetical protein